MTDPRPLAPVFLYVVEIPAFIVLLTYFGLQVLAGSAALVAPEQSFGIAYFALFGRHELILSPEEEFAMSHREKSRA